MIQPLPHSEQQAALDRLADWAGVHLPANPEDRPLSVAEAAALADGGLIEIGAHTMTHPCLPLISAERRRAEIEGSKAACSEIAGREVTSFAYPFGKHCAESAREVAQAGFGCACTTAAGVVEPTTDPFLLPRIHVRDCDGAEFERRLSQWLTM
jgi:peptidoglycan/xylan/chitin deacetylase (PgdA/CDA1 family)